jgi:hypothetical protein
LRDEIHGWLFCSECEKMELRMIEGPTIHGSTRMENEPGKQPGDESGATGGLNMSRNDVSPLSDLMVSDMATHLQGAVPCKTEAVERHEGHGSRLSEIEDVSRLAWIKIDLIDATNGIMK